SQTEEKRRDFQVAIKYADALAISKGTGESLEEVLIKLKDAGANALFVRENTIIPENNSDVNNYKAQGKATYYEGYELRRFYPDATNIKPEGIYIEALDQLTQETVYNHLSLKDIQVNQVEIEGQIFLETQASVYTLATIGVGFNEEDLSMAAQLGYTILPQIKTWNEPTQESIDYMVKQLKQLANLGTIYFADPEVVGMESSSLKGLIEENGLGFVEFYSGKQKGFITLARAASNHGENYTVVRLHTLTDGEVNTYTPEELIERYMLALRERNLSTFLFKLPTKEGVSLGEEALTNNMEKFILAAGKKGFTPKGDVIPYNLKLLNYWSVLLIGIAAIGVFALLCQELGLGKMGVILSILGFLAYALILKMSFMLGAKLMALFGTIIFPTYGMIKGISMKGEGISHAIKSLLTTVAISFGGVLIVIGTVSSTELGLGMELFRGVKISFIIPIVLVLLIMIYKSHEFSLEETEKWIKKPITYGVTAVLAVLALVMLVYITKSGNSGQVIDLEVKMRQVLTTVLGVRPRTKEFLIGYPMLMMISYYGYRKFHWPLLILATMGPISLVNTYTHLHTPIIISLIRSVYGLVIGLVIGIIAIYVVDAALKFFLEKTADK
ncbi:MAG TPA: hypothetical protein GX707_10140, partial [Epulopiscium sp.]|nr:hypothetical protein [Candidatus Epulonipiscium sp.]